MKKYPDLVPWHDIGRFAAALLVALALYIVGVALASTSCRGTVLRGKRSRKPCSVMPEGA